MTSVNVLWYYFWLAPHALQVILAAVMLRRGLHRSFPLFFSYTIFEALQSGVLFGLLHAYSTRSAAYFVAFAIGTAGSTCLRFGLFYEILIRVFREYPTLQTFSTNIFRWMGVFLLLGAAFLAVTAPGTGQDRALSVLTVLDRTMSILLCGLLVGLFAFASYFRLSWRNAIFGISLGLGLFASVELATAALRSQIAPGSAVILDLTVLASYHLCVLVWMFYLLVPEKKFQRVITAVPDHDLETWNQELQRLLRQ